MAQTQTKSKMKWTMLVVAMSALVVAMFAAGCTEPRGELAGCTTDKQCKGVRVCSPQGECVSPLSLPDTGGYDASPGTDGGIDSGSGDTGDTGTPPLDAGADTPDTSGPGPCDRAPTARIGGSATPMTIEPGVSVGFDATSSSAVQGEIADYRWSVVDFPYASSLPHLKPVVTEQGEGRARFMANMLGTYVVELTVVDAAGNESCNTARAEVKVTSDKDIFVELVWDTPGDDDQTDDDGADMDLHYKHPDGEWGYEPLDIFWFNATADWGETGQRRDDPELIRDDEDGSGPESIEHDRPEDLHYAVGVYYYDDYGFGASKATVRVYLDGDLAHEVSAESLPGRDTFYEAVTIDADRETVEVDDLHYEGYPN